MFHTIKPVKNQLSAKAYDDYKTVCGNFYNIILSDYGISSARRIKENFSFLALYEDSFGNNSEGFEISSACAVLLTYFHYINKVKTSGGIKRISYLNKKFRLKRGYNKICLKYPDLSCRLKELCRDKYKMDNSKSIFLDRLSEPYCKMVSLITASMTDDSSQKEYASQLGFYLGRYIYIISVYTRLLSDYENNRLNPLIIGNAAVNSIDFTAITKKVSDSINFTLGALSDVYVEMKPHRHKAVIDNIVNISLKDAFNKLQNDVLIKKEEIIIN